MNLTPEEREERRATGLMIFAIASSVFVIGVIGLFLFFVLRSVNRPVPGLSNVNPYEVAGRPLPTAQQPGELLPPTLGNWQRRTLNGRIDNFSATYTNGDNTISLRGSQSVSLVAAVYSVRQVAQTNGPANLAERILDGDLNHSYYLTATASGVRFAWSHDRWFFDIKATSREALDDFMKIFKY